MSSSMIFILVFFPLIPWPVWSGQDFTSWVRDLRQEALDQGISPETLDTSFADLVPLEEVLDRQRRQPETSVTLKRFISTS